MTKSETQLTLQELREKIFYEAEVTYKPTTLSSPKPEQVVKIGLDDLMSLFQQALTSLKSEMVGLACDKCRVRMEDKLNNGGTQHGQA